MGCGSSSVSTVNEQLDHIRAAVVTGAGVAAYVVSNAGSPEVQGVYAREGMHEGAPCFRNGVYWLCRNGSEWNIAHKDKVEEGDESFYTVEPEDAEALPEDHGWECGSSGALPLPKIEQVLEGPAKLVVEGAGSTQINGTYERSGTYDGAPRYMKAGGNMCIYRSRGNWYRWMIGDFRKVHETDGDMYKSTSASEYPPLSAFSWEADEDGEDPPPRINAFNEKNALMLQGWVPAEQTPAAMAQMVFVATPAMQVVTTMPMPVVAVATPIA